VNADGKYWFRASSASRAVYPPSLRLRRVPPDEARREVPRRKAVGLHEVAWTNPRKEITGMKALISYTP